MENYYWASLKKEGMLFSGDELTQEGRIAYLKGIIENNFLDIRDIKAIIGILPFPKKGMHGMKPEEWLKALHMAKNVTIIDNSQTYVGAYDVKIEHILFNGKFSDFNKGCYYANKEN